MYLYIGHCDGSHLHRNVYKTTPEMRTPPLIRTLQAVPRVSAIEGSIVYLMLPRIINFYSSLSHADLQVAAIGPTTAEALAKNGVKVDASASKPNAESLAQAIVASMTPS